jgi:hypothetical protein
MRRMNQTRLTATQERLKAAVAVCLLLLITILIATSCSFIQRPANAPAPASDEALPVPEDTQAYIEMSRDSLAQQLAIGPESIELDSVTEPATPDGTFIIKLVADGQTYEYHGRNGEIVLISISSTSE